MPAGIKYIAASSIDDSGFFPFRGEGSPPAAHAGPVLEFAVDSHGHTASTSEGDSGKGASGEGDSGTPAVEIEVDLFTGATLP
jgi:hypothetical protein